MLPTILFKTLLLALLFGNNLLYLFLYDNQNYTEICRIIGIVYKHVIPIIAGRSYDRTRVKPSTKWNCKGNRYGNNNK